MEDNPILFLLPNCYRDRSTMQEIADGLTRGVSEVFQEWRSLVNTFEQDRLNPLTAHESWLDTLAYQAGWGDYWDSRWEIPIKRHLIANSDYIFSNRGNREILPYLFAVFGLDAKIAPESGLILGTSLLPSNVGGDPFSSIIRVNQNYTPGSKERTLIDRLIICFLPCWISLRIEYYG